MKLKLGYQALIANAMAQIETVHWSKRKNSWMMKIRFSWIFEM